MAEDSVPKDNFERVVYTTASSLLSENGQFLKIFL
jgi:hypothetical protein